MDFQTKLAQLQTRIDQLTKDLTEKTKDPEPAAAEKTELQIQIADLEKEKSELQNQDSDLENTVKEGQHRFPELEPLVEKFNRKRENQTCNNEEEEVQILQPSIAKFEDTFRFSVAGFSKLNKSVFSPPTFIQNFSWKIKITPKSVVHYGSPNGLGFFLECNGESNSTTWSCQASAELRVLSHKKDDFSKKISNKWFCTKESTWGFRPFMSLDDLVDPENGFIKDDTVTFEAKVAICPDSLLQVQPFTFVYLQLFRTSS
jgi:hypothetical protein